MAPRLPLTELLSAAFVAFVIEADNAAEPAIAHRTTAHGRSASAEGRDTVWLASLAMSFTCLRWLPDGGLTIAALRDRARTETNLDGMRRWGYVTIDKPAGAPVSVKFPPQAIIRPTARGRRSQAVWARVPDAVEQRWRTRFPAGAVDALRDALLAITVQIDAPLPDYLPILHSGLRSRAHRGPGWDDQPPRDDDARAADAELPLVSLLARVLLRCALDYEAQAPVSLAIHANVATNLADGPIALRDLPLRAGVSKQGVAMAVTELEKHGARVVTEPLASGKRGRQVRLTENGERTHAAGQRALVATEAGVADRYGGDVLRSLRRALEPLAGDGTRGGSPLFAGLDPPEDGWRAAVAPPQRLPRFPLVLHRGGYPDGS